MKNRENHQLPLTFTASPGIPVLRMQPAARRGMFGNHAAPLHLALADTIRKPVTPLRE